ncbi:MAG: fasciclin domain-containing protein [Cyanobacteriota bacterium]|nr:fasciclin domain-containing protein [Cyanobacteriota bacterium]
MTRQLLALSLTLLSALAVSPVLAQTATTQPAPAQAGDAMAKPGDIVTVASEAGSFKTLAAALEAADLVETLKGEGPFTVFAPTDEAFAALPEGTLEELLKPENKEKLVEILTYHVVAGEALSTSLKDGEVETVEGAAVEVKINAEAKEVMVNDAKVVQADVKASNGVIHVIDKVILPPES